MSALQTSPAVAGTCVHCGHPKSPGAAFCEVCGKALPLAGASPRVIRASDMADTSAGQTLQSEMLIKQTRSAANALLFVAIVQGAIAIGVSVFAAEEFGVIGCAILGAIAVLFLALALWARRAPLPASVCGLTLFVSLHLLEALIDPDTIARGWLMKAIIIVLLVRGIQAGIKHRQLAERMNADSNV